MNKKGEVEDLPSKGFDWSYLIWLIIIAVFGFVLFKIIVPLLKEKMFK